MIIATNLFTYRLCRYDSLFVRFTQWFVFRIFCLTCTVTVYYTLSSHYLFLNIKDLYHYKVANSKTDEYDSTGENFENFIEIIEFYRNCPHPYRTIRPHHYFFTKIEILRNK